MTLKAGLWLAVCSGVIAYLGNRLLLWRPFLLASDAPHERSLHSQVTPLGGGLGIALGLTAAAVTAEALGLLTWPLWMVGPVLMIASVSYWDDWVPLSPAIRLPVHLAAAVWLVVCTGPLAAVHFGGAQLLLPGWLAIPLTVLLLVWMTNLYNFMDGMDGLAGGMALFGFGVLAILGAAQGEWVYFAANAVIVGAAAGFLALNFPPARIFLGDVGSSLLGFLGGAMLVWGARASICPLWIGVVAFAPFIVDATVTLFRRALRGERVWEGHRSHFYQRLLRLGWSHRRTVLYEYVLMAACAASALWAALGGALAGALVAAAWLVALPALMLAVGRLERRARSCDAR